VHHIELLFEAALTGGTMKMTIACALIAALALTNVSVGAARP
jgi:hypothetical protein